MGLMQVSEYLELTGSNIHRLSQAARISYVTLRRHVNDGAPIGLDVARRLEAFDPRLNACELLGLTPPPAKTRKQRAA